MEAKIRSYWFFGLLVLAAIAVGVSTQFWKEETTSHMAREEPVQEDVAAEAQPPEPLNLNAVRESIGYPEAAHEAGVEGRVIIRVLVNAEGKYERHEVLVSDAPELEQEVVAHLPELAFKPTQLDGKAVSFWVTIPFQFKLSP